MAALLRFSRIGILTLRRLPSPTSVVACSAARVNVLFKTQPAKAYSNEPKNLQDELDEKIREAAKTQQVL